MHWNICSLFIYAYHWISQIRIIVQETVIRERERDRVRGPFVFALCIQQYNIADPVSKIYRAHCYRVSAVFYSK